MKEERLEAAMEHFGEAIEQKAEMAAKKLDKAADRAWAHRPVRFIGRTLGYAAGAGLIVGAIPLENKGYHKTALTCLILGSLIIAAQTAEILILNRR